MPDSPSDNNSSQDGKGAGLRGWSEEIGYGRLLGNTSIFGGAMALNMMTNIVRSKVMALALEPSGTGIYWLYFNAIMFIQALSSLNILTSGVREVAAAWGKGDPVKAGEMYSIMMKVLMILGVIAGLSLFIFAEFASWRTFGNGDHIVPFRWLSIVFIFSNFYTGREVLMQGTRRPGDAALTSLLSNMLGTCCTIYLLSCYGVDGIIPSLISYPVISAIMGWLGARRIPIVKSSRIGWEETLGKGKEMLFLGMALTVSGIVYNWTTLWIRAYLNAKEGESEVGLYSAAFGVTMYATGFIASALAMEFFPRLSNLRGSPDKFSPLVNKQTEVVIMLTAPCFMAALVFSDWLFPALNSEKFAVATEAFRWFLCAAMIQVMMWPMGLIRYAHRWIKTTFALELLSCGMHIGLIVVMYHLYGLTGLGIAYAVLRMYEYVQNLVLGRYVLGYRIDVKAGILSFVTLASFALVFLLLEFAGRNWALGVFILFVLYLGATMYRLFYCKKEPVE